MWNDRRRLVGVLAASLLLNVFLAGVLVGRGFAVHRGPAHPPASGALVPATRVVSLPDDQKRLFQTTMREHREALRAARRTHKAARDKIEADIAAPVFDRAAVTADFEALHQSNRDIDAATGAALTDALSGLSAASRAALVAHEAPPGAGGPGKPGDAP